ncbi:DUF6932 family protein [Streptomyces sp. CA-252508]|uniref:DUF6932 family protein n=1 Tax=Streptomyces sp. CA-252508 TaxID=3418946 RepID=UPI003D93553F
MPAFAVNGFLPLGRHSVSLGDAESMLVSAPQFRDSPTRRTLWDGLISYLDVFLALEDTYEGLLNGIPLIHRVWLGGSFVSTKLDPRNIDTTLLIDTDAERSVRGHRVAHVFEPERFTPEERTYFTERGVWDDWWQRCRLPDQEDRSPSERSAAPARGYLEVRL